MTDDTPTQRLPEATDDTGELVEERKKSKALLFTLVGVGAALLITIIVLLIMLFSNPETTPSSSPTPSGTPTTSPTPSDSPTPTPTPTPTSTPTPTAAPPAPPPPPPAVIVSYGVSDNNVDCSASGGNPIAITFNWNTTGTNVSFGVGTDFADSQPYTTGLPAVGGVTIDYQCGQSGSQQKYAIAVFHNDEVIARKTMVVKEH